MLQDKTYKSIACHYDHLFLAMGKDYQKEVDMLFDLIKKYKLSSGNDLLDIGCGTGEHIRYLKNSFVVKGLDISEDMLTVARNKFPEISFICTDMADFNLGEQFDVIISLFSAVGYVRTIERLKLTITNISNHLKPGGIAIIEPWFTPQNFFSAHANVLFSSNEGISACRMRETSVDDNNVNILEEILMFFDNKVVHFSSNHIFGLFSRDDFFAAFTGAQMTFDYLDKGLSDRGLYIGKKPY